MFSIVRELIARGGGLAGEAAREPKVRRCSCNGSTPEEPNFKGAMFTRDVASGIF
jgi:hypothetical protein